MPYKISETAWFWEVVEDHGGQISGGDAGIRTRGAPFRARRFSKPLVSATHPRLRSHRGEVAPDPAKPRPITGQFEHGNGGNRFSRTNRLWRNIWPFWSDGMRRSSGKLERVVQAIRGVAVAPAINASAAFRRLDLNTSPNLDANKRGICTLVADGPFALPCCGFDSAHGSSRGFAGRDFIC